MQNNINQRGILRYLLLLSLFASGMFSRFFDLFIRMEKYTPLIGVAAVEGALPG